MMDLTENLMNDSFDIHLKTYSTPLTKTSNGAKGTNTRNVSSVTKRNSQQRLRSVQKIRKHFHINVEHDIPEEEIEIDAQDFLPSNQVEFVSSFETSENDKSTSEMYRDDDVNNQNKEIQTTMDTFTEYTSSIVRKNNMNVTNCSEDLFSESISHLLDSTNFRKDVMCSFSVCESSIMNLTTNETENLATRTLGNHLNNSILRQLCDDDMNEAADAMDMSAFNKSFTQKINDRPVSNSNDNTTKSKRTEFKTENSLGNFYGLPNSVKLLIEQYKGINNLYEWQHECLQLPAVFKRQNLIYALPTSGGKTLVAELLMLREVICRQKNVLFVLPFVAIVQEKVWSLSPFAVNLNFLVEEYAAGKGVYPPKKRRKKKSIYVATLEKGLGIVRSLLEENRLDELGLVVIDELHLIGDPSRGHILETMLTNIIYTKMDIQIIGMSATIGNIGELAMFIGATVYTKDFRPIELKEYLKHNDNLLLVNYKNEEIITFERKVSFNYSSQVAKIDPDHLGGLVMEVIPKSACLIFCPTKRNCENVAELLCKVIFKQLLNHKTTEKESLMKSLLYDNGGTLCPILTQTIPWGIAYHHSGLTSEERRLLEDAFRSGTISVLCCTSTLAAGVNLPAQRVILRSPIVGRDFLSLSTYKQMVGRAGRAGFGLCGESIVICSNDHLQKMRELLESPMDQAVSALHSNDAAQLKMLFLNAIALGLANNYSSLKELLKSTLLGVQAERLELNLTQMIENTIEGLIQSQALQYTSIDYNLCANQGNPKECNKKLQVTKLGKAAIKGCIQLHRAHILYDDLKKAQRGLVLTGILHLLYLVTPYELVTSIQPNMRTYYSLLIDLDEEGRDTAKTIGIKQSYAISMATGVKPQGTSEFILNRFYIALMLRDLWNQDPIVDVSYRYQINKGTVQSIMTSAASFSSNVLRFCEEFEEFWVFKDLLVNFTKRLAYCCTIDLLPLMDLPGVKKGRAMQLYKSGYKSLQLIAKANIQDLVESIEHLSRNTARQLIAAAKLLLIEKVENLKDEAEDVMDELGIS